jgi:hypothetical protein
VKKYLSSFVCGFGAGVLQIVPVAKSFSCCLIIPAAAYLALILDRKALGETGIIKMSKGLKIGVITGLYAALFGSGFEILITFITKNSDIIVAYPELQKMLTSFPLAESLIEQTQDLLASVVNDIRTTGFSFLYTFAVISNNLFVDVIFGLIGGLVGVQIINSRTTKSISK